MRKLILIGFTGCLFFLTGKAFAGLPLDQMTTSRNVQIVPTASTASPTAYTYPIAPNWNVPLVGSTAPASGSGGSLVFALAQTTFTTNGGTTISTYTARNCLTDVTATLTNASTFYILDGGTTDYTIYGANLLVYSGQTLVKWEKHWDHLGPWCGTAGTVLTLSLPAPSTASGTQAIDADGYTVITGLGANYNVNQ